MLNNIIVTKSEPDKPNMFVTMWATHVSFLNDLKEGQLLSNALKVLGVEDRQRLFAKLFNGASYVISFSKKADALSMWRGYGCDGCGVAIGFDDAHFQGIQNEYGGEIDSSCTLKKCQYKSVNGIVRVIKKDQRWAAYKTNKRGEIPSSLLDLYKDSLNYKDKGFSEEKEYRLIINDIHPYTREKYYVRGTEIVPYHEVRIPLRSICEIVWGPKVDENKAEYSIRNLLKQRVVRDSDYEYHEPDIEFRKSAIPYR